MILFEDSAALLGLTLAFVGVFLSQATGNNSFDGVASLAIGVLLAVVAFFLAAKTRDLLIGAAAQEEKLVRMKEILKKGGHIDGMGDMLTMQMGPDNLLVAVDLDFDDALSVGELESLVARLEKGIRDALPEVKQVFIEAHKKGAD